MTSIVKKKLLEVLPEHSQLYIMYGATEASARLTYVEPTILEEKIDSIGQEIPGVSVKVLDQDKRELPTGEVGELVASGDNIMQGYWRNPEATAEVSSRHGYHTGDLGYQDKDGYFFIVGRKDNQLKVGGHRINTQEVEDVIMATGLVVEVAVMGVPDPLLGNKLVAVTVPLSPDTTAREILLVCRKKLPDYKVPQVLGFCQSLPKSASGKVDRKQCLDKVV